VEEKREYPVATNSGKNIEIAGVNEVENNSIQRALPLLETVCNSVFPLLRSSQ